MGKEVTKRPVLCPETAKLSRGASQDRCADAGGSVAIRVVVADTHEITRMGIRRLFEAEEDIELVGETETMREALKLVEGIGADILVTCLLLGARGNGIELCERAKFLPSSPRVIFHSAHNSTEELILCKFSEADGYVHKSEKPTNLLEAIRDAYRGEQRWCIGQGAEELNAHLREALERDILTPREKEVFELLRRRRTDTEISQELYISCETVRTHVTNVLRKLGSRSRLDLS